MIKDVIPFIQNTLKSYLSSRSAGPVVLDASPKATVAWRPHVYQQVEKVGWHVFSQVPDSDSWEKRIANAKAADKRLNIGVAATEDVFRAGQFLLACQRLEARLVLLLIKRDGVVVEETFGSAADFVYEKNLSLGKELAQSMLDLALASAVNATDKVRKGVLLEVVVALLLSQVDHFEVAQKGISNRTQQIDVLVHNRGVGGVLGQSPLVLAEAKNWRSKVTPEEYSHFVRKVMTRHQRAKLGFLVTTGEFTSGVALEARRESKEDTIIVMVDGKALPRLWHGSKSITQNVEALVISATVGS